MATSIGDSHLRARGQETSVGESDVFGEKVGFFGKIFGCGHEELSRPFSQNKVGYRVCLKCGARKHFDTETLTTFGSFHHPPA